MLVEAGVAVADSQDAIWESIEGLDEPDDHRHELYDQGRVKRGLEAL